MGRRIIQVCDLHPENDEVRADEAVEFVGPDGGRYQLDLCPDHVANLRAWEEQFTQFAAKATVISPPQRQPGKRRSATSEERAENAAIREWAGTQGVNLGDRGRIPEELRRRYRQEVGEAARTRWDEGAGNGAGSNGRSRVPVGA